MQDVKKLTVINLDINAQITILIKKLELQPTFCKACVIEKSYYIPSQVINYMDLYKQVTKKKKNYLRIIEPEVTR